MNDQMRSSVKPGYDMNMSDRIQSMDWSKTSIGDMASWPQSLKATIKTLLGSRYPMILLWGESLIQIYNDAYTGLIGEKHPYALGRSIKETQAESWDTIGPMIHHVMTTGISNWVPAQLLAVNRSGFNEETYFSLSYSAVENDENIITGMLCVCSEVTQQVLGERRLRLQRDLASRAGETRSVGKVCQDIATAINDYPSDVPFMLLYLRENNGSLKLYSSVGITPESDVYKKVVDDRENGFDPWSLRRALLGETVLTESVRNIVSINKGVWNEPVEKALTLPIPSSVQSSPLGVLIAGISPNCVFNDNYRSFYELLSSQLSVALRNAFAYEEERKRAEALAEIDRAKTAFFSNVSHEFRTPLTLMLGPLEDVLAGSNLSLPAGDRKQITIAYQNALRLLKLVNSLLDFSRSEANRAQASYTLVDLSFLTAELASSFESAVTKASLTYVINCQQLSELIYVDQEMWEKIIFNLISNALKFTFEGCIAIELKESETCAVLTVSDTGVGIPQHELPNIFKRFHRVQNSRSRSHEGTGIGLALTRELVLLHGGSIAVASEEGKGTIFTVSIPKGFAHLDKERVSAGKAATSSGILKESYINEASLWSNAGPEIESLPKETLNANVQQDKNILILIVDDNVQMLNYLHRILNPRWRVEAVRDGREALAFIRNQKPDLVLSDVMMPNMNGFEFLGEIRKNSEWSNIPVILLSARAGNEATVEGLEKGANDYLVKPFYAQELIARVAAQLDIKHTRLDNIILRAREKKFRTLAESTPEKVWSCNPDGVLIYWNQNMQQYTGLPSEEHKHWTNFTHPDDFEITGSIWANANARVEAYEVECRFRRYDGEYRWHLTRAVPEKDNEGKVAAWIGTCTDIHNQKLFAEELEKRVQERTLDLKRINNELEQFAYAASHDLQEPLRKIIMFSQLLENNLADEKKTVLGYIERISTSANRMRILINDLLNFSRLSETDIKYEAIDLNNILKEVIADFEFLIMQKEATLTCGELPVVEAIPLQMNQLFYNLISNALKFTANGRKPSITIQAAALSHNELKQFPSLNLLTTYFKIDIIDNGIGFGEENSKEIFAIFKRLNNRNDYTGTGIGLALCKKIVFNHNGEIFATGIENEGARFSVILPQKHFGD
jgi:PAS domain S-box-containing protein